MDFRGNFARRAWHAYAMSKLRKACWILGLLFGYLLPASAQLLSQEASFTRQDSLRGGWGEGRKKWDVLHYSLDIIPDISSQTIQGRVGIRYRDSGVAVLQLDLQEPMVIDRVRVGRKECPFRREGHVYWITMADSAGAVFPRIVDLVVFFHGKPRKAVNPPWDGGWIWTRDAQGNPWVTVACQGLGASCWFPCKDSQADEPDLGCQLRLTLPDTLVGVSNGRQIGATDKHDGQKTFTWETRSPINLYNIIPYIGKYTHFSDTFAGLKGPLSLDYWVLPNQLEKARRHFAEVPRMLNAFEYWFGSYPFYADGYKLVESPHLGMEHQSAIAYGNRFQNGYLGRDLSGTGYGLKWDFIIIHESGHEWFGNQITSADIADLWIHESFTNYSEALFIEYYYGKQAATEYVKGLRASISNEEPIIGPYGVNREGSSDMYNKGGNFLHTLRAIIGSDSLFRSILLDLNRKLAHTPVTTDQVEQVFSAAVHYPLTSVFDQYLRRANIPELIHYEYKGVLYYRWRNPIYELRMPLDIRLGADGPVIRIYPSTTWSRMKLKKSQRNKTLYVADEFYVSETRIPRLP